MVPRPPALLIILTGTPKSLDKTGLMALETRVEESLVGLQGIVTRMGFLGQSAMAGPAKANPMIKKVNIPIKTKRLILHLLNAWPDHSVSEKTDDMG
jgi:hypothetical protein